MGSEADTYFEQAVQHIRALPKLEGTGACQHRAGAGSSCPSIWVGGLGAGPELPVIGCATRRRRCLPLPSGLRFRLSKIGFHNPRPAFERFWLGLPNVGIFVGQMMNFAELVTTAGPTADQTRDLDYLQTLGQLFTQVVYAQLVCEVMAWPSTAVRPRRWGSATCPGSPRTTLDRIFAVFVQDFSDYALQLYGQASASDEQRAGAMKLIAPRRWMRSRRRTSLRRCCPTTAPTP